MHLIENFHDRPSFDPRNMKEIFHHADKKKHLKIRKIAKFGGEMLQITENVSLRSLRLILYF